MSDDVYSREVTVPGMLIRRDTLQAVASIAEALAAQEAESEDGVRIASAALRVEQLSRSEDGTRRFLIEWPADKVESVR
jgi:hypothetical protein